MESLIEFWEWVDTFWMSHEEQIVDVMVAFVSVFIVTLGCAILDRAADALKEGYAEGRSGSRRAARWIGQGIGSLMRRVSTFLRRR